MASSSVQALSDLVNFQLERLKVDKLLYKDELHLQRQLMELDPMRRDLTQARLNENKQELWQSKQNQHENSRGMQLSESLGFIKDKTSTPPWLSGTSASAGASVSGNDFHESFFGTGSKASAVSLAPPSAEISDNQSGFRSMVLKWFRHLRNQTDSFKSDEESRRLREAGNNSYRKEKHSLKACDYYTEAIFRAPVDSVAAAMAHANRSTVLHDNGMYEESYDDCLCAMDLGYPEEFVPLIKIRQATCALKLRNFDLCEVHLHELLHMELSEAFEQRTHEIWRDCEAQKSERSEKGIQCNGDDFQKLDTKVYEVAWHDNTTLITTNRAASLRASKDIPSNTQVCQEEAFVIVPSGQARVCDNCAITQFIPFPCVMCSNRTAIYCSRKCRAAHASLHAVECFAHRIELFEEFSEAFSKPRLLQLSLRLLITGLPQVLSHCRKKPTINKMWAALNGILTDRKDIPYATILRMESHVDREDMESLAACGVIAQVMSIYLAECTDFFDHLEQIMPVVAKITYDEWQLLSASLLHRHIQQLRHKNLVHIPNFVLPANPHVLAPIDEFTIWANVKRLRCGYLHLLAGDVATVAYGVFPETLALCRHSCDDGLYCKFSGRKLTGYTTTDVGEGETIYNCFASGNYRQSLMETRREELQMRSIDCKCEKCLRPFPDEDFLKFHRYRCDNPNCMQIFTSPPLKHTRNLRWWESDYFTQPENNGSELLVCTVCKETQKLEWFWTFSAALVDCDLVQERCKLYAALERAENQIVDMHECKVELARQLVEQCLLIHRESSNPLDAWEFNKLGSIMRKALQSVAAQYRIFSLEYVRHMSYFWDIMALSDYKCSDKELMHMLQAIEYIPEEFKEIFINYYEDFISPKYANEETYTSLVDTQV